MTTDINVIASKVKNNNKRGLQTSCKCNPISLAWKYKLKKNLYKYLKDERVAIVGYLSCFGDFRPSRWQ